MTFEEKVIQHGKNLLKNTGKNGSSIFNKDWWYGRIMDWSMKNESFKVQMFRFVDVFPYLTTGEQVSQHLKEYFSESEGGLPNVFNFGLGVGSMAPGLMSGVLRKNILNMAKLFITAETPEKALPILIKSRKNSLGYTIDLLGEATLSKKEAFDYQSRYLQLISQLVLDTKNWKNSPLLDENHLGPIPKINVSVKISSLYSQINLKAWDQTLEVLKDRLRPIFDLAMENFVFINIDMEQYSYKDLTMDLFSQLITEEKYRDYPHWGIVVQAYLRDSKADTEKLIALAEKRKVPFTIRLVKGAYWDYETIHASQMNWPIPVYTNKKESDGNFEDCCRLLLEKYNFLHLAIGSHNVRSISAAIIMAEELRVPKSALEIQMLYGMADPIKFSLIQEGYRVREYATVGELIPGIAYLVRRLLENSSNESFLKSKFVDNTATELLLKDPKADLIPSKAMPTPKDNVFYNEPLIDFTQSSDRNLVALAVENLKSSSSQHFPLVIGEQEIQTPQKIESYSPSDPDFLIGTVAQAETSHGDLALAAAKNAFVTWKKVPIAKRSLVLQRLAQQFLQHRSELIALQVHEVGKTWSEADGDITEAIDFCKYYAQQAMLLGSPHKEGSVLGETSFTHYQPRGVSLVIAPWNFPLAILTGMVAASIVTGNTVIMKPAEQSSLVAGHLMKLLQVAGCPPGVVNFLPGLGEEIGEYLVNHKDVDIITFTGSKSVGLGIVQKAGLPFTHQSHMKKCIIEMGGKNAIVVDSDADLDEAVAGVVYSAFGFQGQKCSACSRVIVVESIYDRFVQRLIEATKSFVVGPSHDPKTFLGPLIDSEAQQKTLSMIETAKSEGGKVLYQGEVPSKGHFAPPTLIAVDDPNCTIAQEEVFGPVLAVIKAPTFPQGIDIANQTKYALSGGIYSRSPSNIEMAKEDFQVGNLYLNRAITGAMVGRHPFGGFKLSGLGSKTGGRDYLLQYMESRCVTENTVRRGFAPEES